MSLVSSVEWNVSLGSADVSWGEVRATRTAAKETTWIRAFSSPARQTTKELGTRYKKNYNFFIWTGQKQRGANSSNAQ